MLKKSGENCGAVPCDVRELPFSQAGEVDMGNNCQCGGDKGEEPGRSWLVQLMSRNMSQHVEPLVAAPHIFGGNLVHDPQGGANLARQKTLGAGGVQSFLASAQRHSRCGPRGWTLKPEGK